MAPGESTVKVCPSKLVPVFEIATLVPAVKLLFALKVTTPFVTEKDVKVATPGQDPVQAAKGAARLVTSVSGALVPIEMVLVAVTTSAIIPASQTLT